MSELQHTEACRMSALKELDVLDTSSEPEFDGLVKAAAAVCGAPISLITLVDTDRQWFKANVGLEGVSETPREVAFCAHTIENDGIFEVTDAATDPRFVDNPLVTGAPNIRFYAGVTLRLENGAHVGSLCVIDRKPRQLSAQQKDVLSHLSSAVVQALEARRVAVNLACSEARFRALSAAAPLGIFRTNTDGSCTYTNERWQSIFNLSESEAIGSGWRSTLHPEDKEAVAQEWARAAQSRSEFDMQFRIKHRSGDVVNVRTISRPIITLDGVVTGYVGSVEDVSERLKGQRALVEERRRLESILEGTGAGTWEWNIQTGEMRFNDYWADMLGMRLEDLTLFTIDLWHEIAHKGDSAETAHLLGEHLAGRSEGYECEVRLRHHSGHWIWVHLRGRVLSLTYDGEPEWMFGTQIDITQRKEQENSLRQSAWLLAETGALAEVGGWEMDLVSGTIQWTDQTCRILGKPCGYQPSFIEAINCFELEARPVLIDEISAAIENKTAWDIELPLIQTEAECVWVRSVGHAEYADNIAVQLVGAFQNINERVLQRQALENAHERIKVATESGNIGVWDWDLKNGKLSWTPQMYALYGLPVDTETIDYQVWANHVHPDDRTATETLLRDAIANSNGGFDMEFRAIWSDGSVHYIRASANITRSKDGTALRMLGVNWDVTPLRQLSNKLAEQRELLQVTLQSIGDAVITSNELGQVTWLNPAAEHMTGWSSVDAHGKLLSQVFNILNQDTRQPVENPVQACLKRNRVSSSAHTVLVSRNGVEFGIEESASPIRSKSGDLLGIVLVFHDVTEQRRLVGEMSYRATHDALTGLYNRSEFESRLQRTLTRSLNNANKNALMYIDLDQFKLVNDACGHAAGDQVLVQVSRLLSKTVRQGDALARLGGDEFGVILEDCSPEEALQIAQQICNSMDEFRFEQDKRRFRIGTSIGLVPLDRRWADIESAMQAADTACYAAKEAGRNRVHVWFDTDKAMRVRRTDMQWANRLEQALDENQFQLFAQRFDNLNNDHNGICAEVLVRLLDEKGELIQPNAFLPAAERFNMATRIDRWVLENSVKALSRLPDLRMVEILCINLSGQSVSDRVFHKDAVKMLKKAGSDVCRSICLEITETAAVTNIADAKAFIAQVHALGVRIALDDFGSGASSFGYLKSLTVDTLKIDGQFVTGVIDDPLDAAAVRCFVDIARVMNLKTVAECVEGQDVLDRLEELGIDYAQGFFMHKPEPIEHVFDCLEEAEAC